MLTKPYCSSLVSKRLLSCGAVVIGVASLTTVSLAEDPPVFRQGMWEFNRSIDSGAGKPLTMTIKECTNPTDDMKQQNDMLAKSGCTISAVTRSGNSRSFTSQCSIQGVVVQSTSVLVVESDVAYRVNIESQVGDKSTKELLVARRIGNC